MDTLNIYLSDSLENFINQQMTKGSYSNVSKYIQEHLEKLLLEGLDSGELLEVTDEWWRQKQHQLLTQLNQ